MSHFIAIYFPLLCCTLFVSASHLSILFLIVAIVLFLDCIARYRDFLNIRNNITEENKFRIFRKYKSSRCSRNAAKAAAISKGISTDNFFKDLGYRWWHVFPDKTFTRHSPFLRWKFYLNVIRPKK